MYNTLHFSYHLGFHGSWTRISCISSLHAFRHLLPAFFYGSCCSCMYLLPASLLPWQLLFMHESAACLLPWQLLFMHVSAACLLFCNCCMLLYAFMLLPEASHLWCFIPCSTTTGITLIQFYASEICDRLTVLKSGLLIPSLVLCIMFDLKCMIVNYLQVNIVLLL